MTSLSPTPVVLDDAELLRMVATPRARLFPTLNRASAFAPLMIVCCVLPAFQLLAEPILNEEASTWGLRSLAVANATTVTQLREPGLIEPDQPLFFQPPLSAWLNGLVVRILGPNHLLSFSLVPLVATGIAIWLTTRMAWRVGGANTALIAALLMCSHPQVLETAISPSNGAIGICLLLASVFGFQRHLEGESTRVSSSLIVSGIAWGLLVLAVGPIAFILPLLFVIHALNQRIGLKPENAADSFRNRFLQGWPVLRSVLILVGGGLLIGGWWEVVMWMEHCADFWLPWWTSLSRKCLPTNTSEWKCDLCPLLQPKWQEWINQQALLIGWLIVGLERSWHEWRRPSSEMARRRYQLLLLWWVIAMTGRILAEIEGTRFAVNTAVWNLVLLSPTILIAAVGIGTLIERTVSRRGEFCLIVLLACLTVTRLTMSWKMGLTSAALVATFLVFAPILIPSTGRTGRGWTEKSWQQLLQITVYGSLFACMSLGLGLRCSPSADEERLADLRSRLATFPDVRRISLLVARDPVPVSLMYLLRCRWPHAELVTTEVWDVGLTQTMNEESKSPSSRFLIVEWTRRDVRLAAETGQSWNLTTAGDPMRFHGRKLSLILIEPRTH